MLIDQPMIDAIGFAAAGLVFATFCMRSMGLLRSVALASNVTFIAYGYLGDLMPMLFLHAVLLPVNIYRLVQLTWKQPPPASDAGVQVSPWTVRQVLCLRKALWSAGWHP